MAAVTSAGRASGLEPLELAPDSAAAAALFERHSSHVYRYCKSRLGKREDAEDAVQTTFMHAVRSLRLGVKPLVESAWLLGIARNVCLSRWEAAGRRGRLEVVSDPQELGRTAAAPQGRREELIGLEDALARLPERQRRAVLLRDWRGLSYDEVAEQLGVSRAAVETLIFRGRERLAELLREEPRTIRRRLTSLGNLGALVNAVKTAFAGGAAATKIAVAVTAVAVSGAGIVAGPLLGESKPSPVRPPGAQPAAVPAPSGAAPVPSSTPVEQAPVAQKGSPSRPARRVGVVPVTLVGGAPVVAGGGSPAAEHPTDVPSAEPRAIPATPTAPPADGPVAKRESPLAAPSVSAVDTTPVSSPLAPVTTPVEEVVTSIVPALPFPELPVPAVPELPVVQPVVETVIDSLPVLPVLPVAPKESVPGLLPGGLPPLP